MFNAIRKSTLTVALIAGCLIPLVASSAVRPQLTRIVAYAQDKETPVDIINDSEETYLIQSWLEDLNGSDSNIPLVLTPPVMKLDGKAEGKLRLVVLPAEISQDRESVYWLSLQEIPPKVKNEEIENKLVIAIRSRLKVFVRPKGLSEKNASQAVKSLRWEIEREGGKVWLKAVNPSPYYISFGKLELKAGGKSVTLEDKINMPAPMGSQRYLVPKVFVGKSATLTYSAVNDYGGAGDELTQTIGL